MEPNMKRIATLLIIGLLAAHPVKAEEATTAPSADDATKPAAAAPAAAVVPAMEPTPVAVPAAAVSAATPVSPTPSAAPASSTAETTNAENLEFISGEVGALDEPSKSLMVKLYGETENAPSDKTLKVTVDANTDITDGEQDRDLKSLTVGTEVDVEYDPATNKATYIFVY